MKTLLIRFLTLTLAFAAADAPAHALERPEIHFDKKEWKLAARTTRDGVITASFVPASETAQTWTESVTAQFFPGLQAKVTPEQYADKIKQGLLAKCASAQWRVVRALPGDLTYEWNLSGCGGIQDQSEITRVLKGSEGMHLLHYAYKQSVIPAAKKTEWIKLLSESKLLNSEPKAQG